MQIEKKISFPTKNISQTTTSYFQKRNEYISHPTKNFKRNKFPFHNIQRAFVLSVENMRKIFYFHLQRIDFIIITKISKTCRLI